MARQSGFTIIEVLLFLAVSGLLFVIAAGSLNATIRSTRFTDATNGLENFISQQYSDVRSGVSSRITGAQTCAVGGGGTAQLPGASDTCIVVGRLLDFSSSTGTNLDTIRTYTIVSNRCPDEVRPTENGCSPGAGACPVADIDVAGKIAAYCPRIIAPNTLETYQFQWGASLPPLTAGGLQNPRLARRDGTQVRFNRIAIIHSPTSERVYTYAYYDTSSLVSTVRIPSANLVRNTADRDLLMCLVNSDIGTSNHHFVSVGAGQSSDLVTSGAARPATEMPGGMGCN